MTPESTPGSSHQWHANSPPDGNSNMLQPKWPVVYTAQEKCGFHGQSHNFHIFSWSTWWLHIASCNRLR
jgi:hypothetical protein